MVEVEVVVGVEVEVAVVLVAVDVKMTSCIEVKVAVVEVEVEVEVEICVLVPVWLFVIGSWILFGTWILGFEICSIVEVDSVDVATLPHAPAVLAKSPLVILTQYICFVAESVISRPLVTAAVCVSTLVKTASVEVILVKTQPEACWIYSMTAFPILAMNEGVELARMSAVLDAITFNNVVEAINSEMPALTSCGVVEERISIREPRSVKALLVLPKETVNSDNEAVVVA